MKYNIMTYNPLFHENFEYKKGILAIAQKQDKKTAEGLLIATLIYANAVDYISGHLIKHLQIIDSVVTYNELNAVVYSNVSYDKGGLPLGAMIKLLNNFEFPDKIDFITCLKEFNTLRIKYIHKLMTLTQKELDHSDHDLKRICELGEELLTKLDVITKGICGQYSSYKEAFIKRNYPQG